MEISSSKIDFCCSGITNEQVKQAEFFIEKGAARWMVCSLIDPNDGEKVTFPGMLGYTLSSANTCKMTPS